MPSNVQALAQMANEYWEEHQYDILHIGSSISK